MVVPDVNDGGTVMEPAADAVDTIDGNATEDRSGKSKNIIDEERE